MRTHSKLLDDIALIASKKKKILILALSALGLVYVGIQFDMVMFVISGMMLASYSIGLKIGWGV